jgi:hypothetical protein
MPLIGDGATWSEGFAQMSCPKRVRVVDGYPAVEHLWALGREAFGDEADCWVENVKQKLWEGKVERVIPECEEVLGRNRGGVGRWPERPNIFGRGACRWSLRPFGRRGIPSD